MRKNKTEISERDVVRLLSLKAFEHPTAMQAERHIQSTMQAVRTAHYRPSLHFFPDKSMAWMFAQPRYGIAALFILFFGLTLMNRPLPSEPAVKPRDINVAEITGMVSTNSLSVPVAIPAMQPNYSSLIRPASFIDKR